MLCDGAGAPQGSRVDVVDGPVMEALREFEERICFVHLIHPECKALQGGGEVESLHKGPPKLIDSRADKVGAVQACYT
jgi:hypothetical protein